jgi:hypothetical protein
LYFYSPLAVRRAGDNLIGKLTPVLTAYVVHDIQTIIGGTGQTHPIWTQDLTLLAPFTSWTLSTDPENEFKITQDQDLSNSLFELGNLTEKVNDAVITPDLKAQVGDDPKKQVGA